MKTEANEPSTPIYSPNGLISSKHDMGHLNGMGALMGLTKREHFAAMAMQGMLANPQGGMQENNYFTLSPDSISKLAILHADALITALNQPKI